MTVRLASIVAAAALSLAAPAAYAQAGNWPGRAPMSAYDDITTGSISVREARVPTGYGRGAVDSAKAGNANQQNFPVPQYGQTSGGPAY